MASTEAAKSVSAQLTPTGAVTKYRFLAHSATGVTQNSTAGARCHYVSCEDASATKRTISAWIPNGATVVVEASAAITRGSPVASANDGRAVIATGPAAIMGYALEASAAAGEVIRVQFGYWGSLT